MRALAPFDVIQVSFPYVETREQKVRPAVVITGAALHACGLAWCLMITSARHRPWPGDVAIEDLAAAGLVKPCVVRTAKIATVPIGATRLLGFLDSSTRGRVAAMVRDGLGALEARV
ncbi:MAG: type II toxin-antitoxin system PemK/MazF family toxin [Rhizobiales bacterium]|nr:type II toxin-antitoxin system PemK/MazF family toxin [Hyphomicrobiales bacterium]